MAMSIMMLSPKKTEKTKWSIQKAPRLRTVQYPIRSLRTTTCIETRLSVKGTSKSSILSPTRFQSSMSSIEYSSISSYGYSLQGKCLATHSKCIPNPGESHIQLLNEQAMFSFLWARALFEVVTRVWTDAFKGGGSQAWCFITKIPLIRGPAGLSHSSSILQFHSGSSSSTSR